jgi:diguanylate cyclase (GGDEF)-like protein
MLHSPQPNPPSAEFLRHILDSLQAHIAVLDQTGTILFTNHAWSAFALENGLSADLCGPGVNYLRTCDNSLGNFSEESKAVATGVRAVMSGDQPYFYLEYPCHSPNTQRWFGVRVTRFVIAGAVSVVVSHENITQRKLAELALVAANDRLEALSLTDSLTGVANRRSFETTLVTEWKRHQRAALPLSLAMIDVDFFKKLNDSCGHLLGDDCLRSLAQAIRLGLRRPGDFVARYGGEEFVAILPNTNHEGAVRVAENVRLQVRALEIVHPSSPISANVTISLGVATVVPAISGSANDLLNLADKALLQAKAAGRDRIVFSDPDRLADRN